MAHPAVTVVISTHNGAATLERAMHSIAAQTWTDFEVVAVDDGSSDRSASILSTWQQQIDETRFRIITHPAPHGLAAALNEGIDSAKGQWIARLDDDDWWEPDKLEKQMAYTALHPQCGLLGTWYANHRRRSIATVRPPTANQDIKNTMFRRNPFGHSCVVFRQDLWSKVGGYDETLRHGQDLDLWFRFYPLTHMANLSEVLCHRTIAETVSKPVQMRNHIRTTLKYMHRYQASPINYLYLAEPIAVMLTPRWLRSALRQ